MDRKKLILIIAGVVILTVAAFALGFGYGYRWRAREQVIEDPHWFIELQESNVVLGHHLFLEGKVIEILNRTLTLAAYGDVLTVSIMENARLTALKQIEDELPGMLEPKEITFQDIKIGDTVEVMVELMPDGYLIGSSVTIVPFPPPPPDIIPPAARPTPGP